MINDGKLFLTNESIRKTLNGEFAETVLEDGFFQIPFYSMSFVITKYQFPDIEMKIILCDKDGTELAYLFTEFSINDTVNLLSSDSFHFAGMFKVKLETEK